MDTKYSVKRRIFVLVLGMIMALPASIFLSGGAYADGETGDNSPPIPPDWEEQPSTTPPPDVELPMADDEPPLPPVDDDFNHSIPGIPEYEDIEPEMPELITTPIPDMIVSEMILAEGTVPLGTEAELHVVLENIGIAYVEEIEVAYYLDEISTPSLLAVETAYFEEFSSEQIVFLNMAELSDHTIFAVIDPYDSVAEVREDNNELAVGIEIVSIDSLAANAISQIDVLKTETTNLLGSKGKMIIAHLNFIEKKLADAVSFYDSGKIAQAVNAINNAVDRAFLVVEKYESFYLKGELSESQAVDLMLMTIGLTKTMVTMTDIAVDTPLSYRIASIEHVITDVRIEGTIQAMGNVYWDEIDNELSVILNYYQTAMFKLAKGQDVDVFLDNTDAALIALIEVIETYGAEGWISPELAEWSIGKIEDARAISPPDLTLEPTDIHIDELASLGKTSVLTVKVWNVGGVDANDVTVTVYDETEDVEICSVVIANVPNGGFGEADIYWTPTQIRTHYVRVLVDPGDDIIESDEDNNEARIGFYVVPGTTYIGPVYIPDYMTVEWDAFNTSITDNTIVVSGDIVIDGTLIVDDDITVVMNCTTDNEYKIQVNVTGDLKSFDGNFVSPASTLTYEFLVGGGLELIKSKVQWVWGDTTGNIWAPGGIQLYTNDVFIYKSEIFEGKTHGIYVGLNRAPDKIWSGTVIRDNGVDGIFFWEGSSGNVSGCTIYNHTYGIYCDEGDPAIMNSEIRDNTDSGIYCEFASPTISGNTITNNYYGIKFEGASTAMVSGNIIEKNTEYGIRTELSANPTIINNPSISNSTYGVYAYQSSPTLDGNTFFNNSAIGVMAADSTSLITRNRLVKNNYSVEHYLSPAGSVTSWNTIKDSYCAVYSYGSPGGKIENNTEIANNSYGVYLQESPNAVVENNVVNGSTQIGIFANLSGGTNIRNCSLDCLYSPLPDLPWGIYLLSSSYSNISECNASVWEGGIVVQSSTKVNITDSTSRDAEWGILIRASTFTLIDNCTVENSWFGINLLSNSHNITVSNSTARSNEAGIYICSSRNNLIIDSEIISNSNDSSFPGFIIRSSQDNIVKNCRISNNGNLGYGLMIDISTNITITNNEFGSNNWINLYVYGTEKSHYNHTIDTTNTVGGWPLYYFFDLKDQTIERLEGGHFTFAWCDDITVRYCNSTRGTSTNADPLALIHTNNSRIESCKGIQATYGIWVYNSFNCTVSNAITYYCQIGIYIVNSPNTTLISSKAAYSHATIWILSSDNTKLWNCTSQYSGNQYYPFTPYGPGSSLPVGIHIHDSSFVTMENCTAIYGKEYGIKLMGTCWNTTFLNTTTGASKKGIWISRESESPNTILRNCESVKDIYGLLADSTTNLTISNYTAENCKAVTIYLKKVTHANITVANLTNENLQSGVLIYESSFVHLEDIDVIDHQYGIRVVQCDNVTLERCKALNWVGPGGPPGPGKGGGGDQVQAASITTYGIRIRLSSNTTIGNSTVDQNSYGIYSFDQSSNITIFNATMSQNNYTGLYLSSSKNIYAYNVNITNANETGVRSYDSILNITNSSISSSTLYDFYLDLNSNITTLNTTFNKELVQYIDTESTLTVRWFMHVHVVLPNLDPLEGDVTVVDVNDNTIFTGTTAADGTARWIICKEYVQSQTMSQTITTYYSPYNVSAIVFSTIVGWAQPEPPMHRTSDVYVVFLGNGYNIFLHEGWNLVSVPYQPYDMSSLNLGEVLISIDGKWDYVQYYNTSDDDWKTNSTYKPWSLNDLTHLNQTMGFWLNVTEPCTLVAVGVPQLSTDIPLYSDWNMVGYPARDDSWYTVADLKADTGADIVEGFNASAPYLISELPDTYILKKGEGYWVKVPIGTTWTVNW